MIQKLFILIILFLFSFHNGVLSSPIIGLDESLSDTACTSVECTMDKVLNAHPFLISNSILTEPKLRQETNKTGLFFISLILLFAFSLARLVFPRYSDNLFQTFVSFTFSKRYIREQLENDNRASLWFYSIYLFSTAFLIYQFFIRSMSSLLSDKWHINYSLCIAALLLLLSLRFTLVRIVGWIFNCSEYVNQYLFNKKLINEFLGLVLFPVSVLVLLSSGKIKFALLIMTAIIYLIMFAYSYLRNIPLLRNLFRISFVHFLLYICAFEIIPVLILIKMIR